MTDLELRFEEALALTAKVGPENFARHLDAAWIDEAPFVDEEARKLTGIGASP